MLPGRGLLNAAPGPFSQENMSLRSFVADWDGVEEKVRRCSWWDFCREHCDGVERWEDCDIEADDEEDDDEDV